MRVTCSLAALASFALMATAPTPVSLASNDGRIRGVVEWVVDEPVCHVTKKNDCRYPTQATVSIERVEGSTLVPVKTIRTRKSGRFSVALPPGRYRLLPRKETDPTARGLARRITVKACRAARTRLSILSAAR